MGSQPFERHFGGVLMKRVESVPYTRSQVSEIAQIQTGKNRLATWLAFEAGVKPSEIASLRPPECRTVDTERASEGRLFLGREDVFIYSVDNGQGEARHIAVSAQLHRKLEKAWLGCPKRVEEDDLSHLCGYNIGYGHAWVQSFTECSEIALGYSHGTQGLRHSYIVERFFELLMHGTGHGERVDIVGLETGLEPESVKKYLMTRAESPSRSIA
jgi:hypothetical protein